MKAIGKGTLMSGAGALLLGVSLALSSAGVVSGANSVRHSSLSEPSNTCDSSGYCLTESNSGTGGAITGATKGKNATAIYGTGSGASSIGVDGASTGSTGIGVAGVDTAGTGVGVLGNGAGYGVEGKSTNGDGVYGKGETGYGVYGTSISGAAVEGYSVSGNGVSAASLYGTGILGSAGLKGDGDGVEGFSANGNGGAFYSSFGSLALYAENDATVTSSGSGGLLQVYNGNTKDQFYVDGNGDGVFTGSVTASGYSTAQRVRGGPRVEAFSPESTRATIEDTGTARLEAGQAAVRFDPAFANTIDAARGYQVFLTPNGETRGWLYVAAKYERGFIVREAERGRSSVYFDYRVVADPYGANDERLPQLSLRPPPRPHQHVQAPKP